MRPGKQRPGGPPRRTLEDRRAEEARVREARIEFVRPLLKTRGLKEVADELGISRERMRVIVREWEGESGETLLQNLQPRALNRAKPDAPRPSPLTVAQRLVRHVSFDPASGCWNWTGGHLTRKVGDETTVKRASYRNWNGPIPPGHLVVETCQNSMCFSPFHLATMTRSERRRRWPPAARGKRDVFRCGHVRTPENSSKNSGYVVSGDGLRQKVEYECCKTCRRASYVRLKEKKAKRKNNARPVPLRSIKDWEEYDLERMIRKALRAPRRDRLMVLSSALEVGIEDVSFSPRALRGEFYGAYCRRTGGWRRASWLLSRVFADPRIVSELKVAVAAGAPILDDPLFSQALAYSRIRSPSVIGVAPRGA